MSVSFGLHGHVITVDAADLYLALSLNLRIVDKTRHQRRKLYVEHNKWKNGRNEHHTLHRIIMGITNPHILVDHKDGDGLNNTRDNLRICNHGENARNNILRSDSSSGFKGVSFHRQSGQWQARICFLGTRRHLGLHPTAELAHQAYCVAAQELHGEYARTQ